jgi:lysophospholipase
VTTLTAEPRIAPVVAAPAPLIAAADVPLPKGANTSFVTMRDGARIRIATWHPPGARNSVIILPGATEFIEQFGETIAELTSRGSAVGIVDWRGQGLSTRPLADARRRHIDSFETYIADFSEVAEGAFAALPGPWWMLCQSMGGTIGLMLLARHLFDFAGAILLAPMLSINTAPWPPLIARAITATAMACGGSGRYVLGGSARSAFADPFAINVLTHDQARYARTEALTRADPGLDIGSPTFGWLSAAFTAMDGLARPGVAEAIAVPALICECGEETVVSNAAIENFAKRMPRARLVTIPAAKHAILIEEAVVREAFWREYDNFAAGVLTS